MNRNLFFFVIAILNIQPAFLQKVETRDVKAFSKLRVADNITAVLVPDDNYQVVVDAKNIWNEEVLTTIDGVELKLSTKGNMHEAKITCTVYFDKELTKLTPTYGGMVKTDSGVVLMTKKLEIDANLDGFTNIEVDVEELYITAGQGSDIYISGRAHKVIVEAQSGAKVHLDGMVCEDAEVRSATGAKVWLTAEKTYIAKAITGGKIFYTKDPEVKFDRTATLGGKVEIVQ